MIVFNRPPVIGTEIGHIQNVITGRKICGDGEYTRKCSEWIEQKTKTSRALLTTSCTHALEMAALLCDIGPGDEVIMPSFTFVSTADAFVLRGARIVFVDIRPDTMNIDENKIENAVTDRTKAIAPVHYAGVSCEMNRIMEIADKYHLYVIEDAAQGVEAWYHGRSLGAIGDYGCYSFHETKNISMGEGGAILIRDKSQAEEAEIIREKGTNRARFFRGEIDKYTWVKAGSSYLPSELNAAYLYAQLDAAETIQQDRLHSWNEYYQAFEELECAGRIRRPVIPEGCVHNAHIFYLKTKDNAERSRLIAFLKERGIQTAFHYVPLHTSPAGMLYGRFDGEDCYTTRESERLLRLPMYYGLSEEDRGRVIDSVLEFYRTY